MKDERGPIEPADEEELRSAAALARALEGGGDEPDLPHAALETAALLRLGAGSAELGPERRDAIKDELLAALAARHPAESERRRRARPSEWLRGLPRWLLLGLPLGGTAALCLVLLARTPERDASSAARSMAEQTGAMSRAAKDDLAEDERVGADLARDRAAENSAAENSAAENRALQNGLAQPQAAARRAPGALMPLAAEAESYAVRQSEVAAGDPRFQAPAKGAVGSSTAVGSSAPVDASSGGGSRRAGDGLALPAQRSARLDERVARSNEQSPPGNRSPRSLERSARAALVGLDKDVRAERSELLARSNDAELSRAHAELDAARSQQELERSQAKLGGLLDTAAEGLDPSDARQVRQDVYCRLAETALELGEPRAALEWTRRGIDLDGPPSPFLAQLMALEGDAFAALGEPSSAASSYMKALRVQEALLDESLDGH